MPDRSAIVSAAVDVAETCWEAFGDSATQFTCKEIEAIAQLIRVAGDPNTAEEILAMHAQGDEEGDAHYGDAYLSRGRDD